jgi:predicted nuclease of predicted toxin-antitoxin system
MRTLYADENVWAPVIEGLRRRGWEITSVREEGTLGDTDREHLEYASEREWAILTFDDDFLSLVHRADIEHGGVIFVSQHGKDIGELVRRIDATLEENADRNLDSEIVYA